MFGCCRGASWSRHIFRYQSLFATQILKSSQLPLPYSFHQFHWISSISALPINKLVLLPSKYRQLQRVEQTTNGRYFGSHRFKGPPSIYSFYPFSSQPENPPPKVGIVARFKQLTKDYWYVLFPVHVATSVVWFGAFYLMLKSGVDIVYFLKQIGTSERIVAYLSNSEAGYYALSYACYKIATPIRYTVTVGGTSLAITRLKGTGYLKPSSQMVNDIRTQKDNFKGKYEEKKETIEENVKARQENWKEKYEEKKDMIEDKMKTKQENWKGKRGMVKDKIKASQESWKEAVEEKKDRIDDQMVNLREKYENKKGIFERKVDNWRENFEDKKDSMEEKMEHLTKYRKRMRRKDTRSQ